MNKIAIVTRADDNIKEMTDINTLSRLREKTEQEIEDDLLPFGFIDSGPSESENLKPGFQPVRDNFMADF